MPENFLTFKIINDHETALDFSEVLKQNNIPFYIEEDALSFDPSYANNALQKDYRIKIRQQDFMPASKAFEEFYRPQLDNIQKDYYLFDFSDEELQEIVAKPDEWGYLDYELAKKILSDRGKELQPEKTTELKNARITELSQPETVKTETIIIVYIVTILFWFIGIFIGWYWAYGKKTLPNGDRVLTYSEKIRNHGVRIFAIGIALLIYIIYSRILRPYFDSHIPYDYFPGTF
jgi:hypothetical protein